MLTIKTFIKRHPVLIYYTLTFTISWSGILTVVGPDGIPGTGKQVDTLVLFVLLALFAGPSLAGVVLTGLVDGRAGFRRLVSRMTKWRVDARWYAVAVLSAPLLLMLILLPLSVLFPEFIPGILTRSDKATWLLISITSGLIGGGFLEELGWTGFALPKLRLRYSAFQTGLIMGLLWGVWHLLITLWMSGTSSGVFSLAIFLPGMLFHIVSLTAYRVLMVWIYDRTGSLLVAMLMHASLSASRGILNPVRLSLMSGLTYDLIVAAALWIVVAAGHRKQTLPRQARGALPG
ncbi:MAG TPA: CPBP family intramembrane glutamic endopeptidase [Anaerolineales bacterium]|nr:CPBP family intramembrane glutamic endopeptidase [Anaerolineales bacterium]HLO32252.1 CPBP family intramembrane glutamic endopeptidase [Anaerolineales bacterium]